MYQYRHIIQLLRQGESARQIARSQQVCRDTVAEVRRAAAAQGWLDPATPLPDDTVLASRMVPADTRVQHTSSVEPFRDLILEWQGQGIQATTMRAALARQHGFTGSVDAIYRFLRQNAPSELKPTVILDFTVAEMAQVDFGQGPQITDRVTGEVFKTWIFVATLAWSRHQYAEMVRNQTVATWLACHRHAFEFWNGVPAKVRIDNPKCAITRACYYEPEVQRSYGDLALGYSFVIDPCPVRDPAKKGRVESGVKFVKNNFVPLREFHSLAHANEQLLAWVLGEAGTRNHGTTHQQPLTMFTTTERAMLKPLPAVAPECPVWTKAKLHSNCHVQLEYCQYSAPFALIGQDLWAESTPQMVRLYRDYELVATHPRLFKRGERSTVDDHLPPDAQAYLMRDPKWCLTESERIGPACGAMVARILSNRVLEQLRAAQGLIRLADRYGRGRLEAACSRALNFGTPYYGTVKQILDAGFDLQADLLTAQPLESPYLGSGRFCRNPSDLLQ